MAQTPTTPSASRPADNANATDAPASQPSANEEPRIAQEDDIPSDGRDKKGEQMMEELGRDKPGPPLSEPQSGQKQAGKKSA